MANLAQLNLRSKGDEGMLRALLEDLIEHFKSVYPSPPLHFPLALAVWFSKNPQSPEQSILALFEGTGKDGFVELKNLSLLWKTGRSEPPFANVYSTSVEYFARVLVQEPETLKNYIDNSEVLFFDKKFLPKPVLDAFGILTEPAGLLKGWYVSAFDYEKENTTGRLLSSRGNIRPEVGLVKTQESDDFEHCRGLLHVEVSQRWLPLSPGGITSYSYYSDFRNDQPGYFIFEGGSLYKILKFEVKTEPNYATLVLEAPRDGRYPEVYLRAVHPHLSA
ncbi:MAG TPA: hypothetical protein VKH15_04080 [Candidatus Acidoferrum sp.]|nr:hypothetical protein [Candidatus Acidoferrum sp.]